jgi:hypothetical protein
VVLTATTGGDQQLVDGPGVEGHLQRHLVLRGELGGEGLDGLCRGGDLEVEPLLAVGREAADLNEQLVDIEPVVHETLSFGRVSGESGFGEDDSYLFALEAHPGGS